MKAFMFAALLFGLCVLSAGDVFAADPAEQQVAWYDKPVSVGIEPSLFTPKNLFYVVAVVLGIYFFRGGTVAGLVEWFKSFFRAIPAPPPQLDFRQYAQPLRAAPSAPQQTIPTPEALGADTVLTVYSGRGRLVSPRVKTEFEASEPMEFRFAGTPQLRVVSQE